MNSFKAKKYFLPGLGALALAIGAGNVSAMSTGTISTAGNNDGVSPIYASNIRDGLFGAQLFFLGDPGTEITARFLGKEAGYINTFTWDGTQLYSTGSYPNNTWYNPPAPSTPFAISPGLMPFCFTVDSGADSVCNGANPDNTGVNWFMTFGGGTGRGSSATSGNIVDLWLDDGGAGPDDNHDDIAIRLSVRQGEFSVVPVPAAVWLFGSGLLGLVGIARRRRA